MTQADAPPDAAQVRALAEALVERHARATPLPDRGPTPAFFRAWWQGLAERGVAGIEPHVERIEAQLETQVDWLLRRAGRARVRGGMAEVRLEQVHWDDAGRARIVGADPLSLGPDGVLPIDEIFEVASLSLDLALSGAADRSETLISHYAGESDDFDLYPVIGFYQSLCALRRLERAEPAALYPLNGPGAHAPRVIAMSGPVASGKSTLARSIADHLAAPLAIADRIRDHLVHGSPGRPLHEAGWAEGFEPGIGAMIYAKLLHRGELVLATGRSVVLDACFPTPFLRAGALSLARRHGVPFSFVRCRIDEATQQRRLLEREGGDPEAAGAWLAIARDLEARYEAASELDPASCIEVDTSQSPAAALAALIDALPVTSSATRPASHADTLRPGSE